MVLIIYFENLGGLEHHRASHLNFLIAQCNPHLFFPALIYWQREFIAMMKFPYYHTRIYLLRVSIHIPKVFTYTFHTNDSSFNFSFI
jgi:hypothetical protein